MSGHFIYMFNQYFDSNGDPLAGGKLNFYAANTAYATRKDTYSDSAQTSVNANPVILDAEGRSGPIYGGSGLYDVRITDSDDVLIETKDDIYVGTNPTGTTFAVVDTYAELTALSAGQYDIVYARGNASVNDGGGRFFNWDGDSAASDNSETILEPDSSPTTGRWIARRWDNLLGGDNAASTEIGADIAVDTGGNLKLYAAGHSSKAGDWELRDGSTLVLSYDKSVDRMNFEKLSSWDLGTTPTNAILLDMEIPSSSENRDSHSIIFRGALYDGTGKSFDWKVFNDVDYEGEGPYISALTLSYRQDAAAFADTFKFQNDGRLFVEGLTVNTNQTVTKELVVSGGEFRMTGNVADSTAAFSMSSDIVGTSGISFASLFDIGANTFVSITTDGDTINYPTVSTMSLGEPKITVGAGDTIDAACTMYIKNAPTEGTNNYALFVDSGDSRFDGEIQAESGVLRLAEIATPTAAPNYGKVYTKTDNKLYFQDGAGVEHEIAFV